MNLADMFYDFKVDAIDFNVSIIGDIQRSKKITSDLSWSSDFLKNLLTKCSKDLIIKIPKGWLAPFGKLRGDCSKVRLTVNFFGEAEMTNDATSFNIYPTVNFKDFDFGFIPKCLDKNDEIESNSPLVRVRIISCDDCSNYDSGAYIYVFHPLKDNESQFGVTQCQKRGWIHLYDAKESKKISYQKELDNVNNHKIQIPIQNIPLKALGNSIELMQDFIAYGKLTSSVDIEKLSKGIVSYMASYDGAASVLDAIQNALSELNAQFMCNYDTPFTEVFLDCLNSFLFHSNSSELKYIDNQLPNFLKTSYKGNEKVIIGRFPFSNKWQPKSVVDDTFSFKGFKSSYDW